MSNEEVSKVADEVERRFRVGANVNLVSLDSLDSAKPKLTPSREWGHKFSQNILLDFSTPEEQADVVLGIIEGLNANWEERSRQAQRSIEDAQDYLKQNGLNIERFSRCLIQ